MASKRNGVCNHPSSSSYRNKNENLQLLSHRGIISLSCSNMDNAQPVKFGLRGEHVPHTKISGLLACFLSVQTSLIEQFLGRFSDQFAALPAQFSKKACKLCFCPEWTRFNTICSFALHLDGLIKQGKECERQSR